MPEQLELALLFLKHAKMDVALPDDMARLEDLLCRAWEAGQTRWPTVNLPAELFVLHLAKRWPQLHREVPLEQQFKQLASAEFYLACACAQASPRSLEEFERHYLSKLMGLLERLSPRLGDVEDICQLVRIKLLVRSSEAPPKIAEYSGRGALFRWVHTVALRTAIDLSRTSKEPLEDTGAALAANASDVGAELALIKHQFHNEFRRALHDIFAMLSSDERLLLQFYYLDGLSTTDIAPSFDVNQSTISRRLQSARQRVREETKNLLQQRLQLSTQEFTSFLKYLDSHFDISVSYFLVEAEQTPLDASDPTEPGLTTTSLSPLEHSPP